mmetsp:Transcript_16807/g.46306  ORF Transcript_16807/g.46306 Transcript_16807/m.46306 type:complete len:201 (-) Transcript_16807:179-781(-)
MRAPGGVALVVYRDGHVTLQEQDASACRTLLLEVHFTEGLAKLALSKAIHVVDGDDAARFHGILQVRVVEDRGNPGKRLAADVSSMNVAARLNFACTGTTISHVRAHKLRHLPQCCGGIHISTSVRSSVDAGEMEFLKPHHCYDQERYGHWAQQTNRAPTPVVTTSPVEERPRSHVFVLLQLVVRRVAARGALRARITRG